MAKPNIKIGDIINRHQVVVDNYNNMISSLNDEQKKIFEAGINIFEIQMRKNRFESYVGYALRCMALMGFYFDTKDMQWKTCDKPDEYTPVDNYDNYENYIRRLYKHLSDFIGVNTWDVTDAEVDEKALEKIIGGEMFYDEFGLSFDFAGEQKKPKQNETQPPKYDTADVKNKSPKKNKTDAQSKDEIQVPDIPISEGIDINELTSGDTSPDKFIYAYTDSGVSKNKRNWKPIIMERIAEQVLAYNPPGNMGHVNPSEIGYQLPLPVVTWIGAMTEQLPDSDEKRLWLKGYIIPTDEGNKLKTFIRAKAINSISVYGGLVLLPHNEDDIQDVLDIDLKSIDISGKLKEGLNSSIVKLAGEMYSNENIIEKENGEMADYSKMTLADIKNSNPRVYSDMRTEILNQMNIENEQRVIHTKAGEMDTVMSTLKTSDVNNVANMVSEMVRYSGEMAEVLSIQGNNGALPTMAEIVDKVKEVVGNMLTVTKALKPAENQTVVEKAEEIAMQNKLANNTQMITDVKAKFNELTNDIENEAIKNLIAMQFSNILDVNPENISDDYYDVSVAKLEQDVPNVMNNVLENAKQILSQGVSAGEMALFDNLGVGGSTSKTKKDDELTDIEMAKNLGYSFD